MTRSYKKSSLCQKNLHSRKIQAIKLAEWWRIKQIQNQLIWFVFHVWILTLYTAKQAEHVPKWTPKAAIFTHFRCRRSLLPLSYFHSKLTNQRAPTVPAKRETRFAQRSLLTKEVNVFFSKVPFCSWLKTVGISCLFNSGVNSNQRHVSFAFFCVLIFVRKPAQLIKVNTV